MDGHTLISYPQTLNLFAPGSLGDFNGMNNVTALLPDTIQEIANVLITY